MRVRYQIAAGASFGAAPGQCVTDAMLEHGHRANQGTTAGIRLGPHRSQPLAPGNRIADAHGGRGRRSRALALGLAVQAATAAVVVAAAYAILARRDPAA
jgi:hypothetical protein